LGDNDAYRNEPAFSKRRHQSFRLGAASALAMCSGFGEMYSRTASQLARKGSFLSNLTTRWAGLVTG